MEIDKLYDSNRLSNKVDYTQYYKGNHKILSESKLRYGLQEKNLTVCNYIKFLVNQLLGFMLYNPIKYESMIENNEGLTQLNQLLNLSDTPTIDTEHMLSCLLKGKSLELINVYEGIPVIQYQNSDDWSVIKNEFGDVYLAIKKVIYKKGTFYNGTMLSDDITKYISYDDKTITTYIKTDSGLSVETSEPHYFDIPPVSIYTINKDEEPWVTNDLILLQDAYNYLLSNNIDLVGYVADSLLVIKGYNAKDLTETQIEKDNATGLIYEKPSKMEQVHQNRNLILDTDGDAFFIQKQQDVESIKFALQNLRESMHNTSSIVDFENIINNTATSGIALKIKFQTMANAAKKIEKYFNKGLNNRIDLINIINAKQLKPTVEDYIIKWDYNIPLDDVAQIKNMPKENSLDLKKGILE